MSTPIAVKGSGRCPKCASRGVKRIKAPTTGFYAEELEVCRNCKSIWEPFDPAQLLDAHLPTTSSFIEPCGNCAFRPGSPEQSNPERWAELMLSLKENGQFFCHKGVPLDLKHEHGDLGFAYPLKTINQSLTPQEIKIEDVKKLRMCRGWLNMSLTRMKKER